MTAYEIWEALKADAVKRGIDFDMGSGLRDLNKTAKMVYAIQSCLRASGFEGNEDQTYKVLANSLPNLAKTWHAYDLEAKRAVDRYFKVNPEGFPAPSKPNGAGGEGTQGQGQGQGQGEGDNGTGDGQGQGEGTRQGQGQGEGSEGDGEGGEGDGEGGEGGNPTPSPQATQPEPEPEPVPQPTDPSYIKPDIWDKVMRIIVWNQNHPGKQKNIMLVGPRGIGKTEMVIQMTKSLSEVYPQMQALPYMITSPQAKHEVAGYGNAMGEAVLTEFTKGYTRQSIILVEEIDRSEPTALIALNAATANKIMDTPVIGMIEQHPLCTIIATANTAGVGATEEYITANQLDASTRDRYIYIQMDFDDRIAGKIARGDKQLVSFVKKWNTACELCGLIQSTCSYRAITDIKDLQDMGFTPKECLEEAVLKSCVPKDNLRSVMDKIGKMSNNLYYSTMESIMQEMPDTGIGF